MVKRETGVTAKLAAELLANADQPLSESLETRLGRILLHVAVAPSGERGLLGDLAAMIVAGDGNSLVTGARPLGRRTCSCPKDGKCDCPRRFADPDATWGWDSYREIYVYGHRFYEVAASGSGHDRPIALSLGPGNETDFRRPHSPRSPLLPGSGSADEVPREPGKGCAAPRCRAVEPQGDAESPTGTASTSSRYTHEVKPFSPSLDPDLARHAFDKRFPSEDSCRSFIERLRWPRGFVCPRCGKRRDPWHLGRGALKCRACKKQTAIFRGTVLEGMHGPVREVLFAIWVFAKCGPLNARVFQRVMEIPTYQTAWEWQHKFRNAMETGLTSRIGYAEVGVATGVLGRGVTVGIAAGIRGGAIHQVRIERLDSKDVAAKIRRFVGKVTKEGAVVSTNHDEHFVGLDQLDHIQRIIPVRAGTNGFGWKSRIPRVVASLQRFIQEVYSGGIHTTHVDEYLWEFAFRQECRIKPNTLDPFTELVRLSLRTPAVPREHLLFRR